MHNDNVINFIEGAYPLMSPDNLKVMQPTNNECDYDALQRVEDSVAEWSATNKL